MKIFIILFIVLGTINLISGVLLFENTLQDYWILFGCPIWWFNAYLFYRYGR